MKALVCGRDFALGKRPGRRPCDPDPALGNEYGYEVICQDLIQRRRPHRQQHRYPRMPWPTGDVEQAMRLMSRPFRLSGPVVVGDKRGRLLGFPTANIDVPPDRAFLADGIYATRAHCSRTNACLDSITYVGSKPTFEGDKRATEVFIFDFDEDIYGQHISVDFLAQVRNDMRFSGVPELIEQMNNDVLAARKVLAASPS